MTDAAVVGPSKAKTSKSGVTDTTGDSKKRFEVKKVIKIATRASKVASNNLSSGTQSHYGHGISLSTTAPSAGTISWTSVSSVKPIKPQPPAKSAQWHGASAM